MAAARVHAAADRRRRTSSPCYPYRDQRDGETPEAYGQRLADELDAAIRALGPDKVIAFVAETVGGATAGVLVPVPGYFKAVREVCDRHGVLLILDEVMCGMGRTGTLHACEQEGIVPDLMTIAKGLGGGYQPIGAMLAQRRIVDAMSAGSGFFQHGHTYLGHPVACAAALAVQRVIERDGLLARVRERGAAFGAMLRERFDAHPHVGDVRGRGLFWGVELVARPRRPRRRSTRSRSCTRGSSAKRWRAGCWSIRWAARVDGRAATMCCSRRRSSSTEDQLDDDRRSPAPGDRRRHRNACNVCAPGRKFTPGRRLP